MNTENELRAPDGYIRKPEAVKRLAITRRTLDNWMRRGLVKFHKVGRSVYFKETELMDGFKAPKPEVNSFKCRHHVDVWLPDSVFVWCRTCGAIKRKEPNSRWILTTKRNGEE